MRLDVHYNPEERPEAQHNLRQIPSSAQVDHVELKSALERYETARAAEHETRLAHVQAEQELPAAQHRDEIALADAREKERKDPGPAEEEKHLALIRECRRQHGAAKVALARAVACVREGFELHGEEWEASLVEERDGLRDAMGELLAGWERFWRALQKNAANRAVVRGSGTQSPSVFCANFRVPQVRDRSVIEVADVLDGLRGLAAPQEPNAGNGVENVEVGAEPTRHAPPSKSPFASAGSQTVAFGRQRDPEKVREWLEADEAAARTAGAALSAERRAQRIERAADRRAARDVQQEAEREALEAS